MRYESFWQFYRFTATNNKQREMLSKNLIIKLTR